MQRDQRKDSVVFKNQHGVGVSGSVAKGNSTVVVAKRNAVYSASSLLHSSQMMTQLGVRQQLC